MICLSANDDQELGGERQFLVEIESYLVPDDGCIPNNGKLPLLIYREAIAPRSLGEQPARTLEALFKGNGWGAAWVDGIYDYHHYHSTAHEVPGLARGWAKVQFGDPQGLIAELTAGDVIAIPAGVGHCRLAEDDLVVVGAYPQGQDWDVCPADHGGPREGAGEHSLGAFAQARSGVRRRRPSDAMLDRLGVSLGREERYATTAMRGMGLTRFCGVICGFIRHVCRGQPPRHPHD